MRIKYIGPCLEFTAYRFYKSNVARPPP